MKLQTSIQPRRDGTLNVQGLDGQAYTFLPDADGVLTGDVTHEPTVAHLLGTGNFYPEDPEDFDSALRLADPGGADEDAEVDGEDEDMPADAMPVEANSPLKPLPDPKAGGRVKSKK